MPLMYDSKQASAFEKMIVYHKHQTLPVQVPVTMCAKVLRAALFFSFGGICCGMPWNIPISTGKSRATEDPHQSLAIPGNFRQNSHARITAGITEEVSTATRPGNSLGTAREFPWNSSINR